MPSTDKLTDRLAKLAELADKASAPVPPVTMYAVRPDRDVIGHYESLGIDRCVCLLPPRGDSVEAVRQIAKAVL